MDKRYVIEGYDKRYYFTTLDAAKVAAQAISDRMGIIVGIVER